MLSWRIVLDFQLITPCDCLDPYTFPCAGCLALSLQQIVYSFCTVQNMSYTVVGFRVLCSPSHISSILSRNRIFRCSRGQDKFQSTSSQRGVFGQERIIVFLYMFITMCGSRRGGFRKTGYFGALASMIICSIAATNVVNLV